METGLQLQRVKDRMRDLLAEAEAERLAHGRERERAEFSEQTGLAPVAGARRPADGTALLVRFMRPAAAHRNGAHPDDPCLEAGHPC